MPREYCQDWMHALQMSSMQLSPRPHAQPVEQSSAVPSGALNGQTARGNSRVSGTQCCTLLLTVLQSELHLHVRAGVTSTLSR